MNFTEVELQEEVTSFWGVTYSRYEWLLEIAAHIYITEGDYTLCLFIVME
ncbi:hypothetical protein [Lysinibacillus parviboronicapiens]|nr:hypothetical protein [Lysinibacillus parviboronicapiens]